MSKGNTILIDLEPRGKFTEGYISGTPKPGTCMTIKAGIAMDGTGRFTWEVFNSGADSDRNIVAVLLEDKLQGKLMTDAYADGDRGRLYFPVPGEELNLLKGDVAGTADDFAVGDKLIIDEDTGKVIATTGSPEMEPFICLEAVVDPTADQLVWCMYTGH
jgi:hypothetical protein